MALEIKRQTVTGVRLFGEPREYRDIHLADVTLRVCALVRRDDLEFRNVVRNAVLERCRLDACDAEGFSSMRSPSTRCGSRSCARIGGACSGTSRCGGRSGR